MKKNLFTKTILASLIAVSLLITGIVPLHNDGHAYAASSSTSSRIEKVISLGMKYKGTPYEFGSSRSNTRTFDCSDFVKHVFKQAAGVTLPGNSRTQASYVKKHSTIKRNLSSLKRGDLIFFMSYRGASKSNYTNINKDKQRVTHVAIYLGNNKVLHTYSKKSGGVRVDNIKNTSWEYRMIFGGSAL